MNSYLYQPKENNNKKTAISSPPNDILLMLQVLTLALPSTAKRVMKTLWLVNHTTGYSLYNMKLKIVVITLDKASLLLDNFNLDMICFDQ